MPELDRLTGDSTLAAKAVAILYRLPRLRLVVLDSALPRVAVGLAAKLRLRGAAAVYAAMAPKLRSPLTTWDRETLERCPNAITPTMATGV